MQLYNQIALRENVELYNDLKNNSEYYKLFNRDLISYQEFYKVMQKKYKRGKIDKMIKTLDNIDIINSILDILK